MVISIAMLVYQRVSDMKYHWLSLYIWKPGSSLRCNQQLGSDSSGSGGSSARSWLKDVKITREGTNILRHGGYGCILGTRLDHKGLPGICRICRAELKKVGFEKGHFGYEVWGLWGPNCDLYPFWIPTGFQRLFSSAAIVVQLPNSHGLETCPKNSMSTCWVVRVYASKSARFQSIASLVDPCIKHTI